MHDLVTYFDDSVANSKENQLFFAGFLNSHANWKLFNTAWKECLDMHPSIQYYRMTEAQNLSGQFRNMKSSDRDNKIRRLSFIIAHFQPISFEISVNMREYNLQLKDVAPRSLANPRFVCIFLSASTVAKYVASLNSSRKIDFVFDTQEGVDKDIDLFFDSMCRNLPRKARKLIHSAPRFEDDKFAPPLQAADMLAWHIRRQHELGDVDITLLERLRSNYAHVTTSIEREHLENWRTEFEKLPDLKKLQTKSQWQKMRKHLKLLRSQQYRPPYGSISRNLVFGTRDKLKRMFSTK